MSWLLSILPGDCRETLATLPAESVQTCITSPPYYGLRDYNCAGQIGLEQTPDAYVSELVSVFREVHRVLRADGTLWLNLGDSYANDTKWGGVTSGKHAKGLHGHNNIGRCRHLTGLPGKNLIGIPWRVAFALQADGWILRSDIIWAKSNPMPESVTDRPTKAHEYLFLLSKSTRYFYDAEAIAENAPVREDIRPFGQAGDNRHGDEGRVYRPRKRGEPGYREDCETNHLSLDSAPRGGRRNKRSVWTVATRPYREAHFATFPPDLIKPCILAGCPTGGTVLDAFAGSGTTGQVALELGRRSVLCELNPEYCDIIRQRCDVTPGLSLEGEVSA